MQQMSIWLPPPEGPEGSLGYKVEETVLGFRGPHFLWKPQSLPETQNVGGGKFWCYCFSCYMRCDTGLCPHYLDAVWPGSPACGCLSLPHTLLLAG